MQPHKYHIHLNGQEKQALRQLKRNGKTERRLADRARIILWTADWVAVDEISARLGLHRTTVIFWRQRFVEAQQQDQPVVERLRDRPRSGRPTNRPFRAFRIGSARCSRRWRRSGGWTRKPLSW